ncbi:MAG: serine/threonine-protein kinase [Acidobacteriota bacterium]|jgi:serine/threonine-protein kinase|nr:serine/threonine-protein kinase [Acidobacteriota bacterium]
MVCPLCHTANSLPELAGRVILGGRFKVIRSLGRGGMGEVLLAEDMKLGRRVAVKCISAGSLSDADAKARFLREGQTASRLKHPNICDVYETAEENGRGYIIMRYVDGVTLDQLLKMKPLSVGQVIGIASQVVAGMAVAQEHGIVHRDIKPGNIMIDRSGLVKILDFGLANICTAPETGIPNAERRARPRIEKGTVLGSASYMSPEQTKGEKLDGRSDVFSFGVVLYEMIESRNPFCGDEDIVTLYNILHRQVQFNRPAPEALRAIVGKCLQKERNCRYQGFAEIKQALQVLGKEEAVQFQGGMAKRPDRKFSR